MNSHDRITAAMTPTLVIIIMGLGLFFGFISWVGKLRNRIKEGEQFCFNFNLLVDLFADVGASMVLNFIFYFGITTITDFFTHEEKLVLGAALAYFGIDKSLELFDKIRGVKRQVSEDK